MTDSREIKLKELGAHFIRSLEHEGFTLEESRVLLVTLLESLEDALIHEEFDKIETVLRISKHAIGKNPQEN